MPKIITRAHSSSLYQFVLLVSVVQGIPVLCHCWKYRNNPAGMRQGWVPLAGHIFQECSLKGSAVQQEQSQQDAECCFTSCPALAFPKQLELREGEGLTLRALKTASPAGSSGIWGSAASSKCLENNPSIPQSICRIAVLPKGFSRLFHAPFTPV